MEVDEQLRAHIRAPQPLPPILPKPEAKPAIVASLSGEVAEVARLMLLLRQQPAAFGNDIPFRVHTPGVSDALLS